MKKIAKFKGRITLQTIANGISVNHFHYLQNKPNSIGRRARTSKDMTQKIDKDRKRGAPLFVNRLEQDESLWKGQRTVPT